MTIYLDIVLFENFILNYIILLSTAIISKSKINMYRIIASSLIGGIFSIIYYFLERNSFISIVSKVIISIIMILISFNAHNLRKIIRQLIFFYLTSFTFGGIAFMLLFFLNPTNVIMKNNRFIGTYPLKVTVIAGGIGFFIISIVSNIIKFNLSKKSMICDLEIFYNGKYKKIKTMIDTGNLLKEPISKTDVIIVEKESLREILSNDFLNSIKNILKGTWLNDENTYLYKFKLIPFSSLGNENGLLVGFKPDYIKVYGEEEYLRDDVLIGIYDGKLTRNNLYTSLIGLDILCKEEKKNEFVQKI